MTFKRINDGKTTYCKCAYNGVDEMLFKKTNGTLPRYKCKKCNSFWKNPNHKGY